MRLTELIKGGPALMILAFMVTVPAAKATQVQVHMPTEARWGREVLPAGNYRIDFTSLTPFATVTGQGKTVTLMVTSVAPLRAGSRSEIRLIETGGIPTVEEFQSGAQGRSYRFAVPKVVPARHEYLAARPRF